MWKRVLHSPRWPYVAVPIWAISQYLWGYEVSSAQASPGRAVADSVIAIQFADGVSPGYPSQFAASRPELRDDYVPWYLGRGFYVFAVEPGNVVDTAACNLRRAADVALVNPILNTRSGGNVYMTDLVIVRLKSTAPAQFFDSLNTVLARTVNPPDPRWPRDYYIRVNPSVMGSAMDVARRYMASGLCEFAQPDFVWRPVLCDAPPKGDYTAHQWNLHNTGQGGGTPDADIDADLAWSITRGDTAVRVAVLDVGFDSHHLDWVWHVDHEDMDSQSHIFGWDRVGTNWWNPDTLSSPMPLCNFEPHAMCAHGNSVLGMMAGAHGNGGIDGVAPRCTYLCVKAFDDNPWGGVSDSVMAGVLRWTWLTLHPDIICNSWHKGGIWEGQWQDSMVFIDSALAEIRQDGVAIFFAAGNECYPDTCFIPDPAGQPSVFAIGATDQRDSVWSYSGKGPALDFVAPSGEVDLDGNIWTWDLMGFYGFVTQSIPASWCEFDSNYICRGGGTSLAAPEAAAAAALILSRRRDFRNSPDPAGILFDVLRNSAEDKGPPGYDTSYGWGRINAYRALLSVIHGDTDKDGDYDIVDVTNVVNVAFRGFLKPSWYPGVIDLDCSGLCDINDVVRTVSIVFRGANPPPPCYRWLPSAPH